MQLIVYVCLLMLVVTAGSARAEGEPVTASGNMEVCFTTGNGSAAGADCAAFLVGRIDRARATILVQAYNFTEPRIIKALIDAHVRGVEVTVILDKLAPRQRGEGADLVRAAGIATYIDRLPKIAHNKVMVIDGEFVVTGSFNFSTNANCCNAENLLIIDSPELATAYATNFQHRRAVSAVYQSREPAGTE